MRALYAQRRKGPRGATASAGGAHVGAQGQAVSMGVPRDQFPKVQAPGRPKKQVEAGISTGGHLIGSRGKKHRKNNKRGVAEVKPMGATSSQASKRSRHK